jgi:hypothetical protein
MGAGTDTECSRKSNVPHFDFETLLMFRISAQTQLAQRTLLSTILLLFLTKHILVLMRPKEPTNTISALSRMRFFTNKLVLIIKLDPFDESGGETVV